ncbi:hypothetical protein B0T16DRAFT_6149 [Cercophora newfieldiana]|uniref:Uncharacterized protein n=1 Tax=Cercophora newfieldiana TaxID=92897 RepID=A0AA39YQ43_9PEZI|nr:hypothetical protein B0T16DRAFT_6149 [Cercophora newfieldiana]
MVFVLVLLKNDPVVEHRLQGHYALNRKMVRLATGHIGLAHCATEEGDNVFLIQGSSVPLLLRRSEGRDTWKLCGRWVHPRRDAGGALG